MSRVADVRILHTVWAMGILDTVQASYIQCGHLTMLASYSPCALHTCKMNFSLRCHMHIPALLCVAVGMCTEKRDVKRFQPCICKSTVCDPHPKHFQIAQPKNAKILTVQKLQYSSEKQIMHHFERAQ